MNVRRPGNVIPLPEALASSEGNIAPFEWFREQRDEAAVRWDSERGCWDVFTHDAVNRVLTDPETFSSEQIISENVVFKDTLLALDSPDHTQKRSIVDKYFTSSAVQSYEEDIRTTAERMLDDALAEKTFGSFDVVSSIAYPLPITTITHILGASQEIHEELKQVSDEAIRGPQLSGEDDMDEFLEEQADAVMSIGELINDVILEKQESPGEDLVSDIVTGDNDLSHYELLRLCGLLLVAGHVTTTNLIANMVRCLAERPDALETVRDAARSGNEAVLNRTVEETIRFRSPAQMATRVATEDAMVAGCGISEGDPVVSWLQAANRDPAVFDDPATFDPTRDPNPHMAFGRGPHACLGAPLARLEARIVLEVLFDRIQTLELVETTHDPVEAFFLNGVQELPVRYERAVGVSQSR